MNKHRIMAFLANGAAAPVTYSISGTVYDADGSTAVASATVAIGAASTTSGADGTYTISGLAAGTNGSLTCIKSGYSWTAITVSAMAGNLTSQNYTNVWWAAGGCGASIVGAYRAKGAASYAASKVNLANPGTYDLADGTTPYTPPAWGASGWTFVRTSGNLLKPGFYPAATSWSAIVRFSGVSTNNSVACGSYVNATTQFLFAPQTGGTNRYYGNGGSQTIAGQKASGVCCIAGNQAYLDGAAETGTIGAGSIPTFNIGIGAQASNSTTYSCSDIVIQAIAFYNATITSGQVSALTTAMNAL